MTRSHNRRLVQCAYLMATALVAWPVFDAIMSIRPFHPGDPRWRFGGLGILTNALLLPVAGFVIAAFIGQSQEHRRFLRILGVIALILGGLCIVSMAAFALDGVQAIGTVRPELKSTLGVATVVGLVKLIIATAILVLLGISALSGYGRPEPAKTKGPGILIGRSKDSAPGSN